MTGMRFLILLLPWNLLSLPSENRVIRRISCWYQNAGSPCGLGAPFGDGCDESCICKLISLPVVILGLLLSAFRKWLLLCIVMIVCLFRVMWLGLIFALCLVEIPHGYQQLWQGFHVRETEPNSGGSGGNNGNQPGGIHWLLIRQRGLW